MQKIHEKYMSNRPPRHISRIIILQKKMTFSTNFGAPLQISQLTFTCSKSTTETLEKVWNMFKVLTLLSPFWCFYCQLWIYFIHFPSVPILCCVSIVSLVPIMSSIDVWSVEINRLKFFFWIKTKENATKP